jgi:hypothetical protein
MSAAPGARAAVTAGPYAAVTVVRDGAGYVLGHQGGSDFVAVPEIGGQVIQWLQDGASVSECERRAADVAGEPVDVAGFLDGLAQAGLLPAGAAQPGTAHPGTAEPETAAPGAAAEAPPAIAPWQAAAGRVMFGRAGLAVQAGLAVTAAVVLLAVPAARPAAGDGVATSVPLASLLLLAGVATVLGLAHEAAHVLAAWAAGVPSRISIGRRMIFIVYQTDLTRLWSVPRRARVVPLLAGLLFDGAATGVLAVTGLALTGQAPLLVIHLIRLSVLLNVGDRLPVPDLPAHGRVRAVRPRDRLPEPVGDQGGGRPAGHQPGGSRGPGRAGRGRPPGDPLGAGVPGPVRARRRRHGLVLRGLRRARHRINRAGVRARAGRRAVEPGRRRGYPRARAHRRVGGVRAGGPGPVPGPDGPPGQPTRRRVPGGGRHGRARCLADAAGGRAVRR